MKTVEYVSLMRSIAKEKARAMAKEKGVKGIILVGSVAKGNATEISDVDLFCIGDFKYRRQKEKLKDIVCDVSLFPTSFFQKAFEESNLFQKGSKIDWLRHGIVLYDPNGILGELKERAEVESWSEKDLYTARQSALSAIQEYRETTQNYDRSKTIVVARRVFEIAGVYIVMKNGGLVFYPPMYMLESLSKTSFSIIYQTVNSLESVSKEDAENVTGRVEMLIREFLKRYPNEENTKQETHGLSSGMQTEIKHARDCIEKGKEREAILEARFAHTLCSSVRLWESWGNKWKKKEVLRATLPPTYGLDTIKGRIVLHEELERIGGDLFTEYCSILGLESARLSEKELADLLKEGAQQVRR